MFVLYDSAFWSSVYLLILFAVSVWNGGGFYIEVFGRKCVSFSPSSSVSLIVHVRRFERELEALRKELAEVTAARSTQSSPTFGPQSDEDLSAIGGTSPDIGAPRKPLSPLVTPLEPQDIVPAQPLNGEAR